MVPTPGKDAGGKVASTLFDADGKPSGREGDGGKSNAGPLLVNVVADSVVGEDDFPFGFSNRIPTAFTAGAVLNLATEI